MDPSAVHRHFCRLPRRRRCAGYREYLESRSTTISTRGRPTYEIPYDDLIGPTATATGTPIAGCRSRSRRHRRRGHLPEHGAAVLPAGRRSPSSRRRRPATTPTRWAGLQAHNRWLADFCAAAPGAGPASRRSCCTTSTLPSPRSAGRRRTGSPAVCCCPARRPGCVCRSCTTPYYEPLWAVCEELGMPVNHHCGSARPPRGRDRGQVDLPARGDVVGAPRADHLITAARSNGTPTLQLVLTEQGTAWIPASSMRLDYFFDRMGTAVGSQEHVWGAPSIATLSLKPSEYWARQCHVGASFMRPAEVPLRTRSVSTRSCGAATTRTRKRASRSPARRSASRSPTSRVTRCGDARRNAAELYGFDLDVLRPIGDRVGPLVDRRRHPARRRRSAARGRRMPGPCRAQLTEVTDHATVRTERPSATARGRSTSSATARSRPPASTCGRPASPSPTRPTRTRSPPCCRHLCIRATTRSFGSPSRPSTSATAIRCSVPARSPSRPCTRDCWGTIRC